MLMVFLVIALVVTGAIFYFKNDSNDESSNEKCCETCSAKNEIKYYSIDTKYDKCGECCLNPKLFSLFKLFESGLTLAEDKTCESLGYAEYEVTESHGVFPIKVTLDKYKKNNKKY